MPNFNTIGYGVSANPGGTSLPSITTVKINGVDYKTDLSDNAVGHDKLSERYTEVTTITSLSGTVTFDCSTASVFKLSGDITADYTISLSNYKKGQVITVYPLKGEYTVTLAAAGSASNTFNKIAAADYDGTESNILQIECVDDSASDTIFFYSVATFAASSTI